MMEITIREYLAGVLEVPVFLELPEVPSPEYPAWPQRYVLIEKVGGRKENRVSTESFALQSHSLNSLYEAASLDERVREAMDDLAVLPEIGSSSLASNYNHTDTRTKRYRYQCVYDVSFA